MRRRGERGIALVLVTWVFMILGVLAFDFARYMRDDAIAALNLSEETRNYYIAVAGMNRAIYDLEHEDEIDDDEPAGVDRGGVRRGAKLAPGGGTRVATCAGAACPKDMDDDDDDDDDDAGREAARGADGDDDDEEDDSLAFADGQWHEQELNGFRYGVRVSDEGGLIALNDAVKPEGIPLLRHVVKTLLGYGGTAGMDRHGDAAIGTVVDSIVDWVDADDQEGVNGAESGFYLDREPSYPAKNSDFDSIEELLLVRGVTPELYYGTEGVPGLKDIFTPFVKTNANHPKINIRRAPPAVLQVLLNIDAEEADALIEMREEQDAVVFEAQVLGQLRALDPSLENVFGAVSAKVVRVEARADVSVPRNQARVAAVVELGGELTEGPRIIRWFDRAPWQGVLPTGTGDRPA